MAEKEFSYEYNPVKEIKGGVEASKVIWSTKSLNAAVDALTKGLPLKANPFCGTNTKLLKPELVYKRTQEELDDYIKCMNDPIYFAEKCFLMTPNGLSKVTLRDYQVDYLNHLKNNKFSIFLSCRQSGKCQLIDSQIVIRINNTDITDDTLEKFRYYYISDNIYKLPMFEIYNLYIKQTFLWKIKYRLYKLMFKLKYGRKERSKNNT